jgi:hypothetical protein
VSLTHARSFQYQNLVARPPQPTPIPCSPSPNYPSPPTCPPPPPPTCPLLPPPTRRPAAAHLPAVAASHPPARLRHRRQPPPPARLRHRLCPHARRRGDDLLFHSSVAPISIRGGRTPGSSMLLQPRSSAARPPTPRRCPQLRSSTQAAAGEPLGWECRDAGAPPVFLLAYPVIIGLQS